MSTDRELLEMAAKAAGHTVSDWVHTYHGVRPSLHDTHAPGRWVWNPLDDDGDALRLAVKLRLEIWHNNPNDDDLHVGSWGDYPKLSPSVIRLGEESERPRAVRLAIVRAAAEMGRSM